MEYNQTKRETQESASSLRIPPREREKEILSALAVSCIFDEAHHHREREEDLPSREDRAPSCILTRPPTRPVQPIEKRRKTKKREGAKAAGK